MSKDKAINGSVKVTIDREEFWVKPEELLVNDKPLGEIESELKALQQGYADFKANTLLTLERLILSDKENKRLFKRLEKSLEDFMAKVIKGGF